MTYKVWRWHSTDSKIDHGGRDLLSRVSAKRLLYVGVLHSMSFRDACQLTLLKHNSIHATQAFIALLRDDAAVVLGNGEILLPTTYSGKVVRAHLSPCANVQEMQSEPVHHGTGCGCSMHQEHG